jgi:hypothetical protein
LVHKYYYSYNKIVKDSRSIQYCHEQVDKGGCLMNAIQTNSKRTGIIVFISCFLGLTVDGMDIQNTIRIAS